MQVICAVHGVNYDSFCTVCISIVNGAMSTADNLRVYTDALEHGDFDTALAICRQACDNADLQNTLRRWHEEHDEEPVYAKRDETLASHDIKEYIRPCGMCKKGMLAFNLNSTRYYCGDCSDTLVLKYNICPMCEEGPKFDDWMYCYRCGLSTMDDDNSYNSNWYEQEE